MKEGGREEKRGRGEERKERGKKRGKVEEREREGAINQGLWSVYIACVFCTLRESMLGRLPLCSSFNSLWLIVSTS